MNASANADQAVSRIAGAIAAPARARMLYCLVDGRPRTSTELALVAHVTPSTASLHLQRLVTQRLVRVEAQGRYRYYNLESSQVATALEALSVLAGHPGPGGAAGADATERLRAARTCYDHLAGVLGVTLYDRLVALGWLTGATKAADTACDLTPPGVAAFQSLGIDVEERRLLRRRFAYACTDWSERRPHLAGALGAALLDVALEKRWVTRDRDSRALNVTALGYRDLRATFGVQL